MQNQEQIARKSSPMSPTAKGVIESQLIVYPSSVMEQMGLGDDQGGRLVAFGHSLFRHGRIGRRG